MSAVFITRLVLDKMSFVAVVNNVVGLDMLPSSIFETNDREEEDSEAQSSQEDGQSREECQG